MLFLILNLEKTIKIIHLMISILSKTCEFEGYIALIF